MSEVSKESGITDVELGPLMGQAAANNFKAFSETKRVPLTGNITSPIDLKQQEQKKPSFKVFNALILYTFCSVCMVLVNKSLSSSYNHFFDSDINVLLVVFQAITAVICAHFCKIIGWIEYPSFDIKTAKKLAPVNIFFCLMLFTGMVSLKHNSVPMVTVFKNIANVFTTAGESYFFGTKIEMLVVLAFGVILAGAVAAAWNDAYLTFTGLFWMSTNCMSTSAYVLGLKFTTREVKLPKFGMVFYNNVLCTFFLLPAALYMGQVRLIIDTSEVHTLEYFTKNFFAGFVGFFLNFASLNCVAMTGPTTYAIVGSLNKIPITILGYFIFDSVITSESWFFISVSMAGGFIYSYAKISETKNKQRSRSGI